jgi:hypothetical protein
MPAMPSHWPPGALPRLLDVRCAAFYVGLSPTTFLARVRSGSYPQAKRDGRRRLWDRLKLDNMVDPRPPGLSRPAADFIDPAEVAKALAALGD